MSARKKGAANAASPQGVTPSVYHGPRPRREPVLVVAHPDGWIETYADRHVDIHVAAMPLVSVPAEVMAERYLDSTIPRRYADLYWPINLRMTHMLRPTAPSVIAQRDHDLAMLGAISRAGEILRGEKEGGRKLWTL